MIKYLVKLGLLIFSSIVFSAELEIFTSKNELYQGELFTLTINVINASPNHEPDIADIEKQFKIVSKQNLHSTQNVQGAFRTEFSWKYQVIATKSGEITIQPITIKTNKGNLFSKQLIIKVNKDTDGYKQNKTDNDIMLESNVSTYDIYKNQTFIYNLKIIHFNEIGDTEFSEISSDNALIERYGEQKNYQTVINGRRAKVIEISYMITATGTGKMLIKPATLVGRKVVDNTPLRGGFASFFDDAFFGITKDSKPFFVESQSYEFDVKDISIATKPWLPTSNLTALEGKNDLTQIKLGSSINRTVIIKSEGLLAKNIPDLSSQLAINNAKIYYDTPELSLEMENNPKITKVIGVKKISYSIVPEFSGEFKIPDVKIDWFDTKVGKYKQSLIPGKTIEVLPPLPQNDINANVVNDFSAVQQSLPEYYDDKTVIVTNNNALVYLLIATIVVLLVIILFMYLYLKKILKQNINFAINNIQEKNIKSLNELRDFIKHYFMQHYSVDAHIPLRDYSRVLLANSYTVDEKLMQSFCKKLEQAIYAKHDVNLHEMLEQWYQAKKTIKKLSKKSIVSNISGSQLNPT